MLGNKNIASMLNGDDPRGYDPKDLEVGEMTGRIDPARINEELFSELGIWDENSTAKFSAMDDEDYELNEEAAALGLSQMFESELRGKMKDGMSNEDGKAEFRGYQNKLSKYQSVFNRMQGKLVGKAIQGAKDMYAPQGE